MAKPKEPKCLDLDASAPEADKIWKHWRKKFDNYIEECTEATSDSGRQPNKLRSLTNCVSHSVYEHIDELRTYEECIAKLEALYCKAPNELFARHLLATRQQEPGESIDEFLLSLKKLSKNCNFKAVSADGYRSELVRDSFISGLSSAYIRQRLLENATLTQDEAYKNALSLDQAQKNSSAYNNSGSGVSANMAAAHVGIDSGAAPKVESQPEDDSSEEHSLAAAANVNRKNFEKKNCGYCGNRAHSRHMCPARDAECHHCGMVGHFSKVCLKKAKSQSQKKYTTATLFKPSLCAIPDNLAKSASTCIIKDKRFGVLIDSCSSDSFISGNAISQLNIPVRSCKQEIRLASSDKSVGLTGYCTMDIKLHGRKYSNVSLGVLPNLCSDLILGQDFQMKHKQVIIEYGGVLPALKVGGRRVKRVKSKSKPTCNLTAASVDPVSLFENMRPGCKPIAAKSRRFNHQDRKFIKEEVEKMLKGGIIQPSTSPWRAQVIVCNDDKTHRRKRLCVDFSQTVNLYTDLDAYPLPRIDEMINEIAKHKVFSTFDLRSAYHQVEIIPEERKYTAFEANGRLYEFTRMPMGVTNGVPKFQRMVDEVAEKESLEGTFPYMDNVTVGGMDQEDHDKNVKKFRDVAKMYNLTINESKTISSVPEINILGYCVSQGVIRPDPERLQALMELPLPSSQKSLQRTIGLFAYYSKWLHQFSDKIKPLSEAKCFPLNDEARKAFEELKKELADVALQNIDESKEFDVECDASDVAISATLNQEGRPVAFMSRMLERHEIRYPAIEKEATSLIESVRKWEYLLRGKHFTLVTDQRSVAFMMDKRKRTKIKNTKILNWRLELASLSYTIVHRPGSLNVVADTLSRASCATVNNDGTLYDIHAGLCHPGVTRLLHYVRSKNLPFSTEDVKKVCQSCKICAEIKPRYHRNQGVLIKSTQPMERTSIDFKGPVKSATKNKYLLIAVDEYSRFPYLFPCPNMESSTVTACLDSVFSLCGTTGYVHSDRGPSLMSEELSTYLLERGIASSHSTAYNPRGNGQVERYVQTVWKAVLLSLKSHNLPETEWETVLPEVAHSLRSLINTTTNETPHERFFQFSRKSVSGSSIPRWLKAGKPAFLRKFVRHSKADPLVQRVELRHVNPSYAFVKYPDGRESSVSLRDLAPCPEDSEPASSAGDEEEKQLNESDISQSTIEDKVPVSHPEITQSQDSSDLHVNEEVTERRSSRTRRPPAWYVP